MTCNTSITCKTSIVVMGQWPSGTMEQWIDGQVVYMLHYQPRGSGFVSINSLHGRLSFSFLQGLSSEFYRINHRELDCFLLIFLYRCGWSCKGSGCIQKVFLLVEILELNSLRKRRSSMILTKHLKKYVHRLPSMKHPQRKIAFPKVNFL